MKNVQRIALTASISVITAGLAGCGAGTVLKAQWERYFSGASAGETRVDWVRAVHVDSYGNVVASGSSVQVGSNRQEDILVASHSATGAINWVKTFDLPKAGFNSGETTTAATMDEVGNTYVVGNATRISTTDNSVVEYAGFLSKIDTYGNLAWSKTFVGEERIQDVEFRNGLIYVGGSKTRVFNTDGTKTLEIDHGGASVWDVDADNVGNIYVCGGAFEAKYAANGNLLWQVNNPSEVNMHCTVSVTQYGGVYVAHEIYFADQLRVAKISEAGNVEWVKTLAEPASNAGSMTGLPLVAEAADGSVYAVSSTADGRKLYKLDASGSTLWSRASTDSAVRSLQLDANGNVYLYGRGKGEKFDAAGTSLAKIAAPYSAEITSGDQVVVNNTIYVADTLNKDGGLTGWVAKYSNP